jgi:hypothetical protein
MNKFFWVIAFTISAFSTVAAQQKNRTYVYVNFNSGSSALMRHTKKLPEKRDYILFDVFFSLTTGNSSSNETKDEVLFQVQEPEGTAYSIGFRRDIGKNSNFRFGANLNRRSYTSTHTWTSGRITNMKDDFTTVELGMDYFWAKSKYIDVYSGFSVGRTWQTTTGYKRGSNSHFSSHANLLGVQVHTHNVGFNLECGMGNRGIASAGLVVMF